MNLFRRLRHQLNERAERNSWGYQPRGKRRLPRGTRAVVSLLAVLSMAGVIFFVMNFSSYFGAGNSQREQEPDAPLQDFERLLTKGSYNELLAYASQNQTDDSDSLPEQLVKLKKQIAIADRIIEIDSESTESLPISGTHLFKIRFIMRLDLLSHQHQFENDFVERQIEEYVIPLLSNPSRELAGEAHLCVCYSRYLRFLNSQSDEDFTELRQQFLDSVDFAIEFPTAMQELVEIFRLINPAAPDGGRNRQLLIEVGEMICQSSQPTIQAIGTQLLDQALVASTDLGMIATEVSLNDAEAIASGIEFIDYVATDSRLGESAYSRAILMTELIERMGHREDLEPVVQKLVQSVPLVQRVQSRLKIQEIVDEFLQRWQLRGKSFRLEATKTQSSRVDLSSCNGNVVVIIFFDVSSESAHALEQVNQLEYFANRDVCIVAIELEDSGISRDQEKLRIARKELRSQFPRFIFIESENASEFLNQCPVRTGPFLILLDKNHEVVATNVNLDNLRKLLEKLTKLP